LPKNIEVSLKEESEMDKTTSNGSSFRKRGTGQQKKINKKKRIVASS